MPTVNDANGQPLRIGHHGFAHAYVAAFSIEAHSNESGDTYSVSIEADTGGAACDFFYLKNLSDKLLRIYCLRAKTHTTDTEIQIKTGVSGDPVGGSEVVPVNAKVGEGALAEIVCEQRASGDLALTGGAIFERHFLEEAHLGCQEFRYTGEIILLKNQALVFHAPTDTAGNVHLTLFFHYHEKVKD